MRSTAAVAIGRSRGSRRRQALARGPSGSMPSRVAVPATATPAHRPRTVTNQAAVDPIPSAELMRATDAVTRRLRGGGLRLHPDTPPTGWPGQGGDRSSSSQAVGRDEAGTMIPRVSRTSAASARERARTRCLRQGGQAARLYACPGGRRRLPVLHAAGQCRPPRGRHHVPADQRHDRRLHPEESKRGHAQGASYGTFWGASEGLAFFKRRTGFTPIARTGSG